MSKRLLIGSLAAATVFELVFALSGFVVPEAVLEAFKVPTAPETLFLGHVIAWLLLITGLVCALALRWVLKGREAGWTLSLLLGTWWVAIGLGLFVRYGLVANLFLDALKGAVIAAAAWQTRPRT